jgi:hypothetical protein
MWGEGYFKLCHMVVGVGGLYCHNFEITNR